MDEKYMLEALELARQAAEHGDVPVGCVIVNEKGQIIGRGRNRREECSDATAHAEIEAIREASKFLGDWRLTGCTMYVTLEPCPMCTGAIINSRIPALCFGAREENSGSCGSVIDLFYENYGHRPKVFTGLLKDECSQILKDFFKSKR